MSDTSSNDPKAAQARAKALRPWYRKKRFWLAGIVVLIVIIAIASSGSKPNTGTNPATQTTVAGNTGNTTTTAAPVTYSNVTVVPNTQGSGQSSLASFTIPSDANGWFLGWSYNCSGFGSSGNFIVSVNGIGATQTTDAGVNELGASGNSVESYYDTGTFQLVVDSECNWDLKVTASEPN